MIAVEAALRAETAGLRLRVDGSGRVLTCRLDGNVASLFQALRRGRHLLSAVRAVVPVFVRLGLRVDVVAGPVRLASAGSGVKQNASARLLQLPGVRLGA